MANGMAGETGKIASDLSRVIMKLTEATVLGAGQDSGSGAGIAMSAMAGPLFLGAGLLSKAFMATDGNKHPASCASQDSVLFFCLLMARSLDGADGGVVLQVSPDTYLAAFDDFKKLSATPIDQVVRGDLMTAMAAINAPAASSVESLMARLQGPLN